MLPSSPLSPLQMNSGILNDWSIPQDAVKHIAKFLYWLVCDCQRSQHWSRRHRSPFLALQHQWWRIGLNSTSSSKPVQYPATWCWICWADVTVGPLHAASKQILWAYSWPRTTNGLHWCLLWFPTPHTLILCQPDVTAPEETHPEIVKVSELDFRFSWVHGVFASVICTSLWGLGGHTSSKTQQQKNSIKLNSTTLNWMMDVQPHQ